LGIKILLGCREIAFCPVGYFNLSHPVYNTTTPDHDPASCDTYGWYKRRSLLMVENIDEV